jgi:hypothetical protein
VPLVWRELDGLDGRGPLSRRYTRRRLEALEII